MANESGGKPAPANPLLVIFAGGLVYGLFLSPTAPFPVNKKPPEKREERGARQAKPTTGHLTSYEAFNRAIRLAQERRPTPTTNPNHSDHFLDRGITCYCEKRYYYALAELDQAIKLNQNNGEAYLWRSLSYRALAFRPGAEQEDFEMACRLDPQIKDKFAP
jgi:tetratricopeptide (TPR) repeat protein